MNQIDLQNDEIRINYIFRYFRVWFFWGYYLIYIVIVTSKFHLRFKVGHERFSHPSSCEQKYFSNELLNFVREYNIFSWAENIWQYRYKECIYTLSFMDFTCRITLNILLLLCKRIWCFLLYRSIKYKKIIFYRITK